MGNTVQSLWNCDPDLKVAPLNCYVPDKAVCSVLFRENFKSCKPSFKFSLHRASYYEISVDDGPWEKQKSSGLNVCTGTGSKAW